MELKLGFSGSRIENNSALVEGGGFFYVEAPIREKVELAGSAHSHARYEELRGGYGSGFAKDKG